MFYNELALLDTTTLLDLISLYRSKIEDFDDKFAINVPYKLFKLWIKGKNIDMHQRMIEKEKRESIMARYLIATASEIYKEVDITELITVIANRVHTENSGFADGQKLIHKVVAMDNTVILRNILKLGFN
jgi:hypothetical protein